MTQTPNIHGGYTLEARPGYDLVQVTDKGFGRHAKSVIIKSAIGLFEWVEMKEGVAQ